MELFQKIQWQLLLIMGVLLLLQPLHLQSKTNIDLIVDTSKKYTFVRELLINGQWSNKGKEVNEFNRTAGNAIGSYWCMAYVFSMFKKVYTYLNLHNPLLRTGRCSEQLKYAKYIGSGLTVVSTRNIGIHSEVGDVFINKEDGVLDDRYIGLDFSGHTGICLTKSDSKGRVQTIEGNTNNGGSRNGNGVYIRNRNIHNMLALIRAPKFTIN